MKRQNNTKRLVLMTAGLLVVTACSGSTSTDSTTAPTTTTPVTAAPTTEPVSTSGAAEVDIANFSFNEAEIAVKVGDTVTWTNSENGIQHTTTADEGLWASGALDSGGVFGFTFTEPGAYTYFCSIHPSMTGTTTVSE
ncbi:amicyanin precursor [bacterium BMS3Bbin02]|nr:amicyanin precursor [bacterium BMS3Bbin02]